MKNARSTLALIVGVTVIASAVLHHCFSGAYVCSTPMDRYTYWIGPVSTTTPFAFWAMVSLVIASMRRAQSNHLFATTCGYAAGWIAMSAFSLWIISLPRGQENLSNMGIAVGLTPFLFAPIFPVLFVPGYLIASVLPDMRHKIRTV